MMGSAAALVGPPWEVSWAAFLTLTVVIGGAAAWAMGRALARSWRPLSHVLLSAVLMGAALRFLHYALADGTLLSLRFYLIDTAVLAFIAVMASRIARAAQMVRQYPWLYRRTSPLTWSKRR